MESLLLGRSWLRTCVCLYDLLETIADNCFLLE